MSAAPLASRMRPRTLEEYAGQRHLLAPGLLLRRAIDADRIQSLIFFGPPGTGKTTLAQIIAIGVGMAVVGHPSLRTGRADFPHPALQSVSHPLVAGLVRLAWAKAYREISPSFSKNALG